MAAKRLGDISMLFKNFTNENASEKIMGIFSLQLDKPIEVELDDHDAEKLLGELQRFIVEE